MKRGRVSVTTWINVGSRFVVGGVVFFAGAVAARAADGDLGAWTNTTVLTSKRWAFPAAAGAGHLYVSGGEGTGGATYSTVQRAVVHQDGTLGGWIDEPSLPEERIDHAMVVSGDHIYVAGGYDTTTWDARTSVIYAKINPDGSLEDWQATSAMNVQRAHFGLARAGGCLVAAGGDTPNGKDDSVEYAVVNADGSLDAWTDAGLLTSVRTGMRAAAANGFVYAGGGFGTAATTTEFAAVGSDCEPGTWSATSSFSNGRADLALLANGAAGFVYALGGLDVSTFKPIKSVERAPLQPAGTLGSWVSLVDLPAALENMAFAQSQGRIYLMGGSTGSGLTTAVIFATIEGGVRRAYLPAVYE